MIRNKQKHHQKTPDLVWGYNNCANFIQCKICFGCKNYDSSSTVCNSFCKDDFHRCIEKHNLHRTNLVDRIVDRQDIVIK